MNLTSAHDSLLLRARIAAAVLFILLAHSAVAQAPKAGDSKPDARSSTLPLTVESLGWLEGCWRGAVNQREFREPEYLKAVRGPWPHISIMPTSGVDASNVAEWFRAGAVAVGAVSSVLDPALIQNGDWTELTKRARHFMDAVRAAR